MMNQDLLALIAFGILLAIALFGLFKSSAAAERISRRKSGFVEGTTHPDETAPVLIRI